MHTPPSAAAPGKAKSISPLKRGVRAGKNVIHGRMISLDFFSRHWIGVAIAVLLLVWYITNKYECRTSMERVQSLERRLEIVKGDYVNEHSTYMSRIREGAMEELARKNKLNLRVQDEPPYKLHYQSSPSR
ncbi:MAG: hypothetical protein K2I64_06870 [Muribaculaceae bacterium]|nr:hypothetical protein [Muribaculaceae bacterium]